MLHFEPAPETSITVWREHSQHMTVQVGFPVRFQARNAEAKRHHFRPVKSSQELPSNFAGNHKQSARQQFNVMKTPNFALQPDNGGKLFQGRKLMNLD